MGALEQFSKTRKKTLAQKKKGPGRPRKNFPKRDWRQIHEFGRKIPPVPKNLPEPSLSPTGKYIAQNSYLKRNKKGEVVETPKEMFWRVAHNVACADLYYSSPSQMEKTREEFYRFLSKLEFIPNTPTFCNAAGNLQQLSACFVLPIEDDLNSIGRTFWQTMMIHKTGGGTGFSFSRLRPYGSVVRSTGRTSSGAVYFMWMYADATDRVQQGGYRRGANMGVMNIDHPDILRWITIKSTEATVSSFNLSVGITDEFMEQVEKDSKFSPEGLKPDGEKVKKIVDEIQKVLKNTDLVFGDKVLAFEEKIGELKKLVEAKHPDEGYSLINPDTKKVEARLNARKVFELLARMAWEKGDPGVVFLDRINKDNPTPDLGRIEATNPCGEEPLLPYESCNLGAINLLRMVKTNGERGEIDWLKIKKTVHRAVHFLDNVVDMNKYPLPEIEKMTKSNRKIGLGVMGWANLLVYLGIPYNSPEAYKLAEKLMSFIMKEAKKASVSLAKERGVFPNFKGSIYDRQSPHFKGEALRLRNAALTTIAPTGTTSMLADVNSGVEPFFALWYKKNIVTGDQVETLNPQFVEIAKKRGFYSEDLIDKVKQNKGSVKGLPEVPEDVQKLFPIASDLTPEEHIRIQAAFQNGGVDAAISKTINMPQKASVDDVIKAYRLAHEEGCKGITIYRDRSRKKQILQTEEEEVLKRPRPAIVSGRTHRIKTPVGTAFIHVTRDSQGNVFEVFVGVGKAGSDISADAEAIGRLISLTLRLVPSSSAPDVVDQIIDQLSGIGGRGSLGMGPNRVRSLADAIAKVLQVERRIEQSGQEKSFGDGQTSFLPSGRKNPTNSNKREKAQEIQLVLGADLCPSCGNNSLIPGEGCMKCLLCGYSQC